MIPKQISYQEALNFLMPKHYLGRKPNISLAFGWFDGDNLKAVCTFGKPASYTLCKGICGEQFSKDVYELNRLCRTEDLSAPLSRFVAWCLRQIKPFNFIIVSYSDTAMNHHRYIYQACNFLYLGKTKSRTDMFAKDGKHHRHSKLSEQRGLRKVRSAKHRYCFFCTSNRRLKKIWQSALRYKIQPYPKGDNSNYVLGKFLEPAIIVDKNFNNKDNTKNL